MPAQPASATSGMPPGRFRPSPPLRASTLPLAWPPPTALNHIYWRSGRARSPFLPIIPHVNARTASLRWIRANVPSDEDQALDQIKRYQRLALLMIRQEKSEDQRMFVRQEMRVRRRVDGWFPVGLMNLAYALVCDYGHGVRRIAVLWLAHMLWGAIALCISKCISSMDQEPVLQAMRESLSEFASAILVSIGNAHGLLGLNDQFFGEAVKAFKDVPWYNGIGAFQTIVGVILLFFLLLTIRNRFRMR